MTRVAVFDINETTLDLGPVRAVVDRLVEPEGGFIVWFQRLLQLSMTLTAVGDYIDFSALARHALEAVTATGSRSESLEGQNDERWSEVAAAMGQLAPHPDVVDGLTSLRKDNWKLIALTNSSQAGVDAQLDNASLRPLFDEVLSVDVVRAYKPAVAPYEHAASVAGVKASEMWMVACHDWDLAGARKAGLSTAFVSRPGMSYAACFPPPDLSAANFRELAERLETSVSRSAP